MRKMVCHAVVAAAACSLLLACAQPPPPIQALPLGATPEEVIDYAIAKAHYHAAKASGNADIVMHADNTLASIAQEVLLRQDPRLVDAWIICERYRVARPHDPPDVRSTFPPQFVRDCQYVDRRYDEATGTIRQELEVKIAAADLAAISQAVRR